MKTIKTFKRYGGLLFKDTLLTGVAQVIQSETTFKRWLQISILAIGITGFLFQTGEFILVYWEYDTVQSEGSLTSITQPAVSFCDLNMFRRKHFCTKFPQQCNFYNESYKEIFCSQHPLFCVDPNDIDLLKFKGPLPEGIYEVNFTKEFGSQLDSLASCDWYISDNSPSYKSLKFLSKCSEGKFFRSLSGDKVPLSCFTVESTLGEPDVLNKVYQNELSLSMTLKWLSKDYTMMLRPGFYVAVHSPKQIVNPYYGRFAFLHGLQYKVNVYQRDTVRLSAPYGTQCHDYLKDWVKNDGLGPLNMKECREACEIKFQSHYYGCVSREIIYPHSESVCVKEPSPDRVVNRETRKCRSKCKPACKETEYSLQRSITGNVDLDEAWRDLGTPLATKIEFHFHVDGSTVKNHEPKYEEIELFSYIGGYIGMWLGWSILALLDFLGTVARLFQYPFIKRTQRKANRERLFHRRHYRID